MVSNGGHTDSFYSRLPLLLTLLFSLACLVNFYFSGPHWLHQNGDVNYTYLLSGLDYWSLNASGINDQPAITVKLWNAIAIGFLYLLRLPFTDLSMEQDVLLNSELYLNAITLSVFAVLVFTLFRFLVYSQQITANRGLWLLATSSFFFTSILLINIWVNKPEPYLVIAGLWLSMLMLKLINGQSVKTWAIVCAMLVAVFSKITIAPFLLPLLFLIPKRQLLKQVIPIGTAAFIFICLVWHKELIPFIQWIGNASSHTGAYGTGDVGFYNGDLLQNLLKTIRINKLLLLVLTIGTGYTLTRRSNRRPVLAMVFAYLIFFLFILKMPTTSYFIVCYIFAPVFIILAFQHIKLDPFLPVVYTVFALLLLARIGLYTRDVLSRASANSSYCPPKDIQTYYSSSKEYALLLANKTQFNRHASILDSIYPESRFYWFDNQFYSFNGVIDHRELGDEELTVTGTSNYIESDSLIEIITKNVDGVHYNYTVRIKP